MPTTLAARSGGTAGHRRTTRRLAVRAVGVLAVAAPLLAGCGGFGAQTNQVYQPAVGSDVRTGSVDVLAAVVVSAEPGKGVFLATLVNNGDTTTDVPDDRLTGIDAAGGVQVGEVPDEDLPSQQPVDLADDGGVPVTGSDDAISTRTSSYVTLRLSFERSDPVTVRAPVVVNNGPYADFATSQTPLPTPNSVASQGAAGTTPSVTPSPPPAS